MNLLVYRSRPNRQGKTRWKMRILGVSRVPENTLFKAFYLRKVLPLVRTWQQEERWGTWGWEMMQGPFLLWSLVRGCYFLGNSLLNTKHPPRAKKR